MTLPRRVVPFLTHMMTRRCTQRSLLLRPDAVVVQIFEYCLAEAALRFGITLLGWMMMSNHQHLLVRDNRGNYPEFLAHFHKMTAKALNAHWGRRENLWSSEQPNVVHVVEAHDRFEKLVYLLANPVASHLVERVSDWPGASSYDLHLSGESRVVERPSFFRENGRMPAQVTLRVERPDGFESLTQDEWVAKVHAAVAAAEDIAREERATKHLGLVGRAAVLAAKHTDRPETLEPRSTLRPCLACKNGERRAHEISVLIGFRVAYRAALERWRGGERDVVFPAGTYRMRTFAGVRHEVHDAPTSIAA